MATSIEQLVTQAMELPGESRARLAELLVESLEADDIGPVEKAWVAEAKSRRDDVRAGRFDFQNNSLHDGNNLILIVASLCLKSKISLGSGQYRER